MDQQGDHKGDNMMPSRTINLTGRAQRLSRQRYPTPAWDLGYPYNCGRRSGTWTDRLQFTEAQGGRKVAALLGGFVVAYVGFAAQVATSKVLPTVTASTVRSGMLRSTPLGRLPASTNGCRPAPDLCASGALVLPFRDRQLPV